MKKLSLTAQIASITGGILLLCTLILTVASFFQADQAIITTVAATTNAGRETSWITYAVPAETLANVQRQFNLGVGAAMLATTLLGCGLVYLTVRRALRPLQELGEAASAINANSLDTRLDAGRFRPRELQTLCQSFNGMLERLHDAFEAQKRFSASAAHELRTPLATMLCTVQVAQLDGPSETLQSVERSAKRLQKLIDDLLAFSGGQPDRMEPVKLQPLWQNAAAELEGRIREKQLHLQIGCGGLPTVLGDSALCYRAFFNLLDNAVKFSRPGGAITVSAGACGNLETIRIADNGPGIPPDQLPHIFEPFYRGAQQKRVPGNGLGLAVTEAVLRRQGWKIAAESVPGKGTAFILTRPRMQAGLHPAPGKPKVTE